MLLKTKQDGCVELTFLGHVGIFDLYGCGNVSSTNNLIRTAIHEGISERICVIAETQDGGYGRQGRSWSSPEGGLYMSLLLRPDADRERSDDDGPIAPLSMIVALSVKDALSGIVDESSAADIAIKWPNDVVVGYGHDGFRKLCGISLEGIDNALCIGIGVNVFRDTINDDPNVPFYGSGVDKDSNLFDDAPRASDAAMVKNTPIYIADMGAFDGSCDKPCQSRTIEGVAKAILLKLQDYYSKWLEHGMDFFLKKLNDANILQGSNVRIEDRNGRSLMSGRVEGISTVGELIIANQDGSLEYANSGEAHVFTK